MVAFRRINAGRTFRCLSVLALVSTVYCQTDLVAENISNLKASNVMVRRRAAAVLGESSDPRAIEALIAAFGDRDADVKTTAVSALARIGVPAVQPLITALKHPHDHGSYMESYEVDALAKIGVPAVRPLSVALKNTDYSVTLGAAHALARIGVPACQCRDKTPAILPTLPICAAVNLGGDAVGTLQ